jgi:hypothetical protein
VTIHAITARRLLGIIMASFLLSGILRITDLLPETSPGVQLVSKGTRCGSSGPLAVSYSAPRILQ